MATVGTLFDDPTSRTRMAWSRTILVTGVLTALLLRAVFILGKPWPIAVLLIAASGSMAVLALARMRMLAKHPVTSRAHVARRTSWWISTGVVVLAAIGIGFALL